MNASARAPWPYRRRVLVFGGMLAGAISLGNFADALWRQGPAEPAYVAIARAVPALHERGTLGVALALTCAGFGLRVWGAAFLHARSVWSGDFETGALHAGGPFRYVRNPLYLGTIVLSGGIGLLGSPLACGLVVAGSVALCRFLARSEQPHLRAAYGSRYSAYAAAVPGFIPKLRAAPQDGNEAGSWRAGFAAELPTFGFVLAMLEAIVSLRPGALPFWLALLAGPTLAAGMRLGERRKARRRRTAARSGAKLSCERCEEAPHGD